MSIVNLAGSTPLTIHEFKLFAPAQVNQVNTLAYLDTGANLITISPKLAEGLPRAGTKTVGSAFEQRTFEVVETIEIDFLGHHRCADARVNSISDDPLPFSAEVTLDTFTIFAQTLIFDFRLLNISLAKQASADMWIELPAKFLEKTGACLLQLASQDGTVYTLFDTGAGLSVINSAHVAELHLNLQPAFDLEISDAVGAKTMQTVSLCSGLHIGNVVLPSFDCFSVDLQTIETALGNRIDLVLGANAMLRSGFRWCFDKLAGQVFVAV